MNARSKTIIIAGGGFGGLSVALELAKRHDELHDFSVLLVDRNTQHLYTPLLYEVASAFLQDATRTEALCMRSGVCIPFSFLEQTSLRQNVHFVHGEITGVNTKRKTIAIGKKNISYEYCVLALGSVPEDYAIPGIREHGYFFKWMDGALTIHQRIDEFLSRKKSGKEKRVTIVIGGGGATGVELAAELSFFCRHACERYRLRPSDFQVTLIEATNRILGAQHPNVSAKAKERLFHLGVDIQLDTCIKQIKKGSVVIAPRPLQEGEDPRTLLCDFREENEKEIEADVFIWSGGIRAPDLLKTSGLLLDGKGRVDVHDTLLAKGSSTVFALGDCAALLDPRTNRVVPALAQAALAEGKIVAENLIRSVAKRHLHSYPFQAFVHLIPAGGKYAFAEFGPFAFRGLLAWILRRFVDLKYFLSILPVHHAFKTWWDGWRVYTRND